MYNVYKWPYAVYVRAHILVSCNVYLIRLTWTKLSLSLWWNLIRWKPRPVPPSLRRIGQAKFLVGRTFFRLIRKKRANISENPRKKKPKFVRNPKKNSKNLYKSEKKDPELQKSEKKWIIVAIYFWIYKNFSSFHGFWGIECRSFRRLMLFGANF